MKKLLLSILFIFLFAIPSYSAPLFVNKTQSLTWTAPATYNDGTGLAIAGYKVYYSTTSGTEMTGIIKDVGAALSSSSPSVSLFSVGLQSGAWFVVVTAYDSSGNESAFSNEINITFLKPNPPANLGIK